MSKNVISQILVKENRRIRAAGGDATSYFAKSLGKAKKKQDNGKKCTHCKRKGHDISECHTLKRKQEEKAAASNTTSNGLSSRSSGRSSGKSTGKSSGKASKSSFNRGINSAKIAAADDNSGSESDDTIQVFLAHATPYEEVECVYKTKAELCQSNL